MLLLPRFLQKAVFLGDGGMKYYRPTQNIESGLMGTIVLTIEGIDFEQFTWVTNHFLNLLGNGPLLEQ